MKARIPLAVACALLALAAHACGGSSKSKGTTSVQATTHPTTSIPAPSPTTRIEAAFIGKANTVCARANAATARVHGPFPYHNFDPLHPDVKLLPKVGAFFASSQSIADRVPVELRQLGTPHRAQRLWSRMLTLSALARTIGDRQIQAAKASDVPAFVATVRSIERTEMELGRLALEAGFSSSSPCGKVL